MLWFCAPFDSCAAVAKLADAPDLGSGAVRRGGSSPSSRTPLNQNKTCQKFEQPMLRLELIFGKSCFDSVPLKPSSSRCSSHGWILLVAKSYWLDGIVRWKHRQVFIPLFNYVFFSRWVECKAHASDWGGVPKMYAARRSEVCNEADTPWRKNMGRVGIEPTTYWLRVNCSTNWAIGPREINREDELASPQSEGGLYWRINEMTSREIMLHQVVWQTAGRSLEYAALNPSCFHICTSGCSIVVMHCLAKAATRVRFPPPAPVF